MTFSGEKSGRLFKFSRRYRSKVKSSTKRARFKSLLADDALDLRQCCRVFPVIFQQFQKSLLALADHDSCKLRESLHQILRVIRNLRSAKPERGVGQQFGQLREQILYDIPIPDIAGKGGSLRSFLIYVCEDGTLRLIDRVLCDFERTAAGAVRVVLVRVGFQAVDGWIGVDIFGVDPDQQDAVV